MARKRPRWWHAHGGITDGRFTIRRDSHAQLRHLGVPAFFPYALHDRDRYIKHFPNVEQARTYAEAQPPPKEET